MLKNLEAVARALSDPTRLRIIKLLGMRELCVCQLAYLLHASQSRISQNLSILKYADLVTDTRQGRLVFYALNRHAFEQAMVDLSSLISEAGLDSMPEMSGELKRWQAFPPDLDAICPVDEDHVPSGHLPAPEVADLSIASGGEQH